MVYYIIINKSNLDARGNGQPLEPVFEIPLHMMQKVQLNSCLWTARHHCWQICKQLRWCHKTHPSSNVCGEISIALHNADLQAIQVNTETANERRARERAQADAMILNPDALHDRLVPTQIVITKPGGNVPNRVHDAFGAYQQRYFNGFDAARETAPASTSPHLHVQAVGEIRLAEKSTKALKIHNKHIRKELHLPPNMAKWFTGVYRGIIK